MYIRFLPRDSTELFALEDDSTLALFDYPLDFEIATVGHWYHDPSIPDHLPTYQYTVVKPDYVLPDTIKHELLAELLLIDDLVEDAEEGRIAADVDFLRALEDEALRITDNWEERSDLQDARWNPRGRVRVKEVTGRSNKAGVWLPVKKVRVRARRWFTIKTDYTDSQGNYCISSFTNRPVNYSVVFQTTGMRVTNWLGYATRHNGPKKESPWSPNFEWHSDSWVHSTMINAITDFKTEANRHGLKVPGSSLSPYRVRAVFRDGRSSVISQYVPFGNHVKIFTKEGSRNLETDELYKVTMHELGHSSHFSKSPINFTLSLFLAESFAVAVEYYFTLPYYPAVVALLPDQNRATIICCSNGSWRYTPFFIDLRDNTNQLPAGATAGWADDRVSGYTLKQMQTALDHKTKLSGIRTYLRDKYSNSTEGHLGKLVDFYQNIKDNH